MKKFSSAIFAAAIVMITSVGPVFANSCPTLIQEGRDLLAKANYSKAEAAKIAALLDETVAVLAMTVPGVTPAPTWTTKVKTALPIPNDVWLQETVPPEPAAGVVQLHPAGEASETKVVPVGSGSESVAPAALLGPALATVMV